MMFQVRPRSRLIVLLLVLTFAQACAPQATDTPFRPPTQLQPTQILSTTTPIPAILTPLSTSTVTSTPTEGPCSNHLKFVQDVTIPDGTTISVGSTIDKQWLVDNSGSCNWDSTYRLKWIGGDPMGANQEQLLYPARAGKQATLRILFTAPTTEGTYESAWQAYGPDGIAFGDLIYIKVVITS
ncbi:hypothetical protein ANAEL_02128 [Anaerolineales bacterium]|nr:hypothetical protein ANAEL_02128 [Anaerolineales bacterium]